MATRAALGASRWRLARQTLAESMLLSAAGGLAGLGLAVWAVPPLASVAPSRVLGAVEPQVDWRVLCFALLASLATGVLFGLLPALQASRVPRHSARSLSLPRSRWANLSACLPARPTRRRCAKSRTTCT